MLGRRPDAGRLPGLPRGVRPVLATYRTDDPAEDPARPFADYVAGLHEWRTLPYVDPGLPTELPPPDWEGTEAWHCSSRPVTCSKRWRGITSRTQLTLRVT